MRRIFFILLVGCATPSTHRNYTTASRATERTRDIEYREPPVLEPRMQQDTQDISPESP